jgi:hypothetical protein
MLVLCQWQAWSVLLSHSEPVKGASMIDEEMQFEETEPESEQDVSQRESEGFDAYRSVVRLFVGLALVGGDELIGRLREWEAAHSSGQSEQSEAEIDGDTARRVLVGMAFETAEMARQVVWGAAGLSASVAGAMWSAFRPITSSFLFRPLWAPVRSMRSRSEARFDRYYRVGRSEEQHSRKLADEVTGLLIEDIVRYVGDNPGVKALIDTQVAGLATRAETLDPLVREVGDRYIAYLNEHPQDVQNLVQGQAVGMATEVRDDIRTITVTGDTFLETLARSLLRRTPREDLPPPPPEVRRRAVHVQRQAVPGQLTDDVRYLKET